MGTRTFILDTSVILYDAKSLHSFSDNNVVIPYVVLEELDKFKNRDDSTGSNARQAARKLNELRQENSLSEGVEVNSAGGRLRVELNFADALNQALDVSVNDDRILNVCLGLKKTETHVILVTNDINLAVRADVLGVEAQAFDSDRPVNCVADMYTGCRELEVPDGLIEDFYAGEEIHGYHLGEGINPNEYLLLVSETDHGKTALVRVSGKKELICRLRNKEAWGIKPRNKEQHFAMDAVLDPSLSLVTLTGKAGTGKTVLALACALQLVQEENIYDRLVISRPIQPLGNDIGYLPGDVGSKLDPWMGPIKDAINFLTGGRSKGTNMYEHMLDTGILEIEPLTYIRGRSMPNTIFILDEAQDLNRAEIKTIVSRLGENSKLVLIGDVLQISNPYLDATNSGLSNVVEKFKKYEFSAHVTLIRGERSILSAVASEIL